MGRQPGGARRAARERFGPTGGWRKEVSVGCLLQPFPFSLVCCCLVASRCTLVWTVFDFGRCTPKAELLLTYHGLGKEDWDSCVDVESIEMAENECMRCVVHLI